jgi:hypothetical protein
VNEGHGTTNTHHGGAEITETHGGRRMAWMAPTAPVTGVYGGRSSVRTRHVRIITRSSVRPRGLRASVVCVDRPVTAVSSVRRMSS